MCTWKVAFPCIEPKTNAMKGSSADLPVPTLKKNKDFHGILLMLDALFSACVVAPACIAYWRSVWELMGVYVYPKDSVMSAVVSTIIGVGGNTVLVLVQEPLTRVLTPDKNKFVYYVASRVYTVAFAFVCINGWRGPWRLIDLFTKQELNIVAVTTVVAIVALAMLRSLRNVSAPPFVVAMDHNKGYFEVATIFRVSASEQTALYILDCIFSVVVIGTLVVFVWRGGWVLLDLLIFPENFSLSSWTSLVLGYILVAVAFLAQPVMKWICDRLTGAARLLVADAFLIFSLVGTLNVWRGLWAIANLYILPENLELSCWITHWVCLTVLILLGCSNSLLVRGVYIDAEEPAGECVIFPCHYLRIILQSESQKKLNSKLQLEDVEKKNKELDQSKGNNIVNHCPNSCTLDINHKSEICENDVSNQIKH